VDESHQLPGRRIVDAESVEQALPAVVRIAEDEHGLGLPDDGEAELFRPFRVRAPVRLEHGLLEERLHAL
jgi:hypothetical protein